jgi:hypothetical protein
MNKTLKLKPPQMPNFIFFENNKVGKRQDGFKTQDGFPITDLSEEEAVEFAEFMKQEFISHYKRKKEMEMKQ